MVKTIVLAKDVEQSSRWLANKDGTLDGNNYIQKTMGIERIVYTSDEIVNITDNLNEISTRIEGNFEETFKSRGGATKEQLYFAKETGNIIFGESKSDSITVIPAPCGFGKSSITREIIKELMYQYNNNLTTDGIIIVTDKLESLKEINEEFKEYTYVLEGWNKDICINDTVTSLKIKMCTPKKCPYFYDCKRSKQLDIQKKYPILLITNARLKECAESIHEFKSYSTGQRVTLLIDERPSIMEDMKVNKALLNEVSTAISKLEYKTAEDKTKLEEKFDEISNLVSNRMRKLRINGYKRFIVSNINNDIICKNDDEFMGLWHRYMKKEFTKELEHIHTILTKGGFYVYEEKMEFIATIKSKNLKEEYKDKYKVIIFDGTALYDPQYLGMYNNDDLKFLFIENTRSYSNLTINTYMKHKLTRNTFKDKKYMVEACAKFIKNNYSKQVNGNYIVTYQDKSVELKKAIANNGIITKCPMYKDRQTFYFGNTKGSNAAQECNKMFQMGWETMPDYEYVIKWLSIVPDWDKIVDSCSNIEKAKWMSEMLEIKDRSIVKFSDGKEYRADYACYEYGVDGIEEYKILTYVTNFYQEVHRTKLRNYNYKNDIEVYTFSTRKIILKMIKELLPQCKLVFVEKELQEFLKAKTDNRKNKIKGYDEFIKWHEKWDGTIVKVKEIKEICGCLSTKQWENLKKNMTIKEIISKLSIPKKGYYIK